TLNKVKTQGNYLAKKVTTSDETKLTASASTTAANGTHQVRVDRLASVQYVTGSVLGTVTNDEGEDVAVSGSTKLTQLGFTVDPNKETMINIKAGSKEVSLGVTAYTTVNDFLSACKDAGLNASYDVAQKRFFIGAADSGVENAFSITTSTAGDTAEKNAVRDLLDYSKLNSAARKSADDALAVYKSSSASKEEKAAALDTLNTLSAGKVSRQLAQDYKDGKVDADALAQVKADAEKEYRNGLKDGEAVDADALKKAVDSAVDKAAAEYAKGVQEAFEAGAGAGNPFFDASVELGNKLSVYAAAPSESPSNIDGNDLENLGLGEVTYTAGTDGSLSYTTTGKLALQEAADSLIQYNGAALTGSSNAITVNGLTLNLNGVTKGTANEYISVNVSKDSQAVYDMIRDFVKGYNEILGEMNDAYNADSARGYEPLTAEERESMTEEQIKKWEDKIKGSLLRRDDTLAGLLNVMKTALQGTATYDGKTYSLASFGVRTIDYTEYGKLHILGDQEDALAAGEKDKLMAAIEEDPEKVMTVFTQITGKLYDAMNEKMKSSSLSSALTFYNDKQMTKELTAYKKEKKSLEARLNEIEDRYYKQFTAMEKAMATLNSQTNSLAALMGSN
ncbi:MAG: flagellar filament capping protein FliD, partial [Lachnospiraceae bacterium]|nr:flagellar filament capping protein FliD [Lachnospiraceae bacterium]